MMELGPVRWPLLLDERGGLGRGLLSWVGLELMHELNAGGTSNRENQPVLQ